VNVPPDLLWEPSHAQETPLAFTPSKDAITMVPNDGSANLIKKIDEEHHYEQRLSV